VNEIFLGVVVLLLLGMIIMMFKYAKYIHNLPKTENKKIPSDEHPESKVPDDKDSKN
jgi:F0F1-type ATP synthase assembly protein I